MRHISSWSQSFCCCLAVRKTSRFFHFAKDRRGFFYLWGSQGKGKIQGPRCLYRTGSTSVVGCPFFYVKAYSACFFGTWVAQYYNLSEKAESPFSTGCFPPVACFSVAMGWKALDAGPKDMFKGDCLSLRALPDLVGCIVGQILRVNTVT